MRKIITTILALIVLGACNDFLDEVPKDRLTSANFYETKEDAVAAVNAIYSAFKDGKTYMACMYWAQLECMSDYATGRGSYIPVGEYQGLDDTNIGRTEAYWSYTYQGVNLANIAVKNIPKIEMNDESKSALIAEAKFLRAFFYYHLVINWGDAPLFLEPVESYDMVSKPRTPMTEIYSAIISDLQDAEKDLPSSVEQYGHPTKWSAKSLLSLVYLTRENWTLAKEKAGEVIQSGEYSLIEVTEVDDFNKIFGSAANGTSEEIFYIKYNNQVGSAWPYYLLYKNTEYGPYGAYVLYSKPDYPFIKNWNDNDLRKQFDIFSEYIHTGTGKIKKLPSSVPILFSKFRDPGAPGSGMYSNDIPILRYAEILLIYAEAASQESNGPSALAVEYLNMVKRRAYGYSPLESSPVDYSGSGWTASSFQDTVLQERAYEFFMEGKRWHDLKRTNKVKEVILAGKGMTVADKHLLWPIPQNEIESNPMINQEDQNPGY